ncbi:hypothetical protein L1987_36511 [Smallanthus sonchifolius]|uniref:Uncharacterized protein n=1 Tax=Smallanthus sonchifolius TaxID=185202 RepID=A0ACB9HEN2_9ASTR|nr:hypothetical protein L1987_36511 [Smallanthus sonchifolius]
MKGNNDPSKYDDDDNKKDDEESIAQSSSTTENYDPSKLVIFVTNSEGVDSPGLTALVEALAHEDSKDYLWVESWRFVYTFPLVLQRSVCL